MVPPPSFTTTIRTSGRASSGPTSRPPTSCRNVTSPMQRLDGPPRAKRHANRRRDRAVDPGQPSIGEQQRRRPTGHAGATRSIDRIGPTSQPPRSCPPSATPARWRRQRFARSSPVANVTARRYLQPRFKPRLIWGCVWAVEPRSAGRAAAPAARAGAPRAIAHRARRRTGRGRRR